MKPGATINPVASKTSAPWGTLPFPDGATSCIFSPFRRTSRAASVLEAGSRTRPFLIRSIGGFLGFHFERRMRVALGSSGNEEIKNGHANRDSVSDLFENAGLRAIGDIRRDFDAAIYGPGMEDDGVRPGTAEPAGIELVTEDVIVGRERGLVEALGLDAEHHDNVGPFQGFLDPIEAANRRARRDFFKVAGNPHGRAAEGDAAAEFFQKVNIGARNAAMKDVAKNGDVEMVERAFAVADGQRVEKALRRVFVDAVDGAHDRELQMPR